MRLKSDQNGIESKEAFGITVTVTPLKSDQNGIERFLSFQELQLNLCVEIRPKWDWKIRIVNAVTVPLSGVEIRPKWDWKNSATNSSGEYSLPWTVEIRPKWDWK